MLSSNICRLLADNALLQPQYLCADVSSFLSHFSAIFAASEHVDNINRLRNFSQGVVAFLAENVSVHGRIHRDDPVPPALHGVSHHV
ncbi:hypothetical protein D3C80_1776080 [compost metagenome]